MADPTWLTWAREIQAIAQTGLAFGPNTYDRERYERLRELAAEIVARHTDATVAQAIELFGMQHGYATPKVDVRGAAFDGAGRILMVREVADAGRWTLPGGWADVNLTPAENVIKEVREESGYDVRVRKLAAAWDRTCQGHAPGLFSCVKLFFICDITGGEARTSSETSEIGWFTEDALPPNPSSGDISRERTLAPQLHRMFAHARDPGLPTEFD
jgi:ADP-ribose pyrophosphatase YjhB (NUDIX family)